MAPMTAEELLKHPEYEHTIWDLEPTQKAKLPVAAGRGGPLNIAYEIHGRGKIHLVVRRLFYTYIHDPPSCIHPYPNITLPKWIILHL